MAADAPQRPAAPSLASGTRNIAVWAGIAAIFATQMPMLDETSLGNVLRVGIVLWLASVAIARAQIIRDQLLGTELFVVSVAVGLVLLASITGIFEGFTPQPAEIFKFLGLNLLCFLVGKSLTTYEDCTRYLRFYYLLAVAAAVQGVIALGLDFAGLRQLFAIPVFTEADRRYFLPWFGLLGGDVGNYRTYFYFSESTYFAQMLLPAIAYAIVCRRRLGFVTLVAGFATTSAGGAAIALAGMLALLVMRLKIAWWIPAAFVACLAVGVFLALDLLKDSVPLLLLFARDSSVQGKLDTFSILWQQLEAHPFGIGPVNLSSYFGTLVNTGNGLFQIFVPYGVAALLLLICLVGVLVRLAVTRPRGPLSAALAISLLGVMASGVTHGPLLKYYAAFMLAVTITLGRLEGLRHHARPTPRENSAGELASTHPA